MYLSATHFQGNSPVPSDRHPGTDPTNENRDGGLAITSSSSSLTLQSHFTLQSCGPRSASAGPENRKDTRDHGIDTCG